MGYVAEVIGLTARAGWIQVESAALAASRLRKWRALIQSDWLLSPSNPSVRYLALTELLGEPAEGGEAAQARREIMTQGAVPLILAAQNADGHFGRPGRFYNDKYSGTVWQLIILAELGADPGDARVRAACEAILRDSQHPDSGGFSVECSRKTGGGLASGVIPCLTGNLVFSLIRLGYLDDPRLQRAVDWIATWQRFDDNDGDAPTGCPYDRYEMCWGRHTCHMGAAKALKALAEIPPERRSPAVRRTLADGTEYFLKHHVHKRSHDLDADLQARLAPLPVPPDVPDRRARDPWHLREAGGGSASRPSAGTPAIASSPLAQTARQPAPRPACPGGPRSRREEAGRRRTLDPRPDLQRPLPRRHRGQGRAQPLDHAEGAAGAEGGGTAQLAATARAAI